MQWAGLASAVPTFAVTSSPSTMRPRYLLIWLFPDFLSRDVILPRSAPAGARASGPACNEFMSAPVRCPPTCGCEAGNWPVQRNQHIWRARQANKKIGRAHMASSRMTSGLTGSEPLSPAARRTVLAGFIGFAVDFFDIYLPALALAPVIGYFEPPGLSSMASTTIYFFTFAATLFGRPCGAVIFGHWADKIGRRRTTMISIVGFGPSPS